LINKSVFGGTAFIVGITILSCLAVLGVTAWSSLGDTASSSQKQEAAFEERLKKKKERLTNAEIPVQNLTNGLTVIKLEKNIKSDSLRVLLRNDYAKTITAYDVSVGSGTIQSQCLTEETDERAFIHPGDTREETYPLQDDVDTLGIRVLAVVFEDKTSDGEQRYIQELQEYRTGLKIEIEGTLRQVKDTLQLSKGELQQAIARLASSTPERDEEALPHFVKLGLRDATARVTSRKQSVLQNHQNDLEGTARALGKFASRLEETLSKL
jgi:hypothetical protein